MSQLIYDVDHETRLLFEQRTLHKAIDFEVEEYVSQIQKALG